MILKKLIIYKFGPFATPAELEIEPAVTVITGPNDTGKSSILRLIEIIFTKSPIDETNVNLDSLYEMGNSWEKDTSVQVTAVFTLETTWNQYFSGIALSPGDEVQVTVFLAPSFDKSQVSIKVFRDGNEKVSSSSVTVSYPQIIKLPNENAIRASIKLSSLNELEAKVIAAAFGDNASQKLSALSEPLLQREIEMGNKRLNKTIRPLFPHSMPFELRLRKLSNDSLRFSLNIVDSHESDTLLTYRGTGAQKIVNLVASLLNIRPQNDLHTCIIFDEPETSLHADAQHFLRSVLEELAENPYIQVIYITHSPSMVNSLRPESLRLLTRTKIDGKPTSQIDNRPIKENYLPVRSSLGLTPSDSLLYAPIAFIVEGLTEILCIPILLKKFGQESVEGFDKVSLILSNCHFIDGQGDSFEYWCRLAKSQGSKPIIFVDGDKIRRVRQEKLEEKHPDVPVIVLDEGSEFEEIVDRDVYFQALALVIKKEVSAEAFEQWIRNNNVPEQMMFSKKIDRWLQDTTPEVIYSKVEVMREAVKIAALDTIKKEPLLKIVHAISNLLA